MNQWYKTQSQNSKELENSSNPKGSIIFLMKQ